jgi:hypothetical protein
MNKLIEELAEQAGFNEYMLENLWAHEQPEFYKLVEKFAELIILECAKIVATAVALREPASTYVSKILELRNEQTD